MFQDQGSMSQRIPTASNASNYAALRDAEPAYASRLRTAINCSGLGTEEIRALRADPEGNLKQ